MFQSSPIVKKLFWVNIIVFILCILVQLLLGVSPLNYLALFPFDSPNFQFGQFLTSLFMHGSIMHLLFNMLALVSFGPEVENQLGENKFLLFYFIMGIFSSLTQQLIFPNPLIGASGAIYGLMIYFTLLNPNQKLSLFLLPIYFEAKKLVAVAICLELVLALIMNDGIAHWAHLGGALSGFLLYKLNKRLNF
jgi:membrane associated rhomboid family serine protease